MFTRTVQAGGGGKTHKILTGLWDYLDEQKIATDANPLTVATGDFSKVTKAVITGAYGYNFPAQNSGSLVDITLNEWIKSTVGTNYNTAWRYIKITPTEVQIGHGGYGSTSDSIYGTVQDIILLEE